MDIFQMITAYLIYITEELMLDPRSFFIGLLGGAFIGAVVGFFAHALCVMSAMRGARENEDGSDGL